eukprot:9397748-Pyramimonas_sp.AAC.1
MAPPPPVHQRKWFCKHCVHERTGKPFLNFAENKQCHQCKRSKGQCFNGYVALKEPSTSTRQRTGSGKGSEPPWSSAEVQKLSAQVKQLQEQLKQARKPPDTVIIDADGEGAPDLRATRVRLAEVEKELAAARSFSGAAWESLAKQLATEQSQLQQELLAARPQSQQMRILLRQIEGAERGLQKSRDSLEASQRKVVEMQAAIQKEKAAIVQQEAELADFRRQQ